MTIMKLSLSNGIGWQMCSAKRQYQSFFLNKGSCKCFFCAYTETVWVLIAGLLPSLRSSKYSLWWINQLDTRSLTNIKIYMGYISRVHQVWEIRYGVYKFGSAWLYSSHVWCTHIEGHYPSTIKLPNKAHPLFRASVATIEGWPILRGFI